MVHITRMPLRSGFVAGALLVAGSATPAPAFQGLDRAQLVRVDLKSQADLDEVERLGGLILNCHPGVGPMDVVLVPEQRAALERRGLRTRVLQENLQAAVERERAAAGAVAAGDPFADFFLAYHPYGSVGEVASILWYMNELVTRYPAMASFVNVGTTLQGRTIWGLRLSNGPTGNKPAVVYFGCEHAREWITTTVPTYFANYLLSNYGTDGLVTELLDEVEFFLIPVFNVDGYVHTWSSPANRLWRKNRRNNGDGTFGVDINRNWGEGWGGQGASSTPSNETFRGAAAFSEPETAFLRDFFNAHPNVRAQLDIHSFSQLILWPHGYTATYPADQDYYHPIGLQMQSLIYSVHGKNYVPGPVYTTIYPASGVSVDWTYAQRDILSYSFECRDTGFYGFELPADQIIPNNEELIESMLLLANNEWVRAPLRYRFPSGLPLQITAGTDAPIPVELVNQSQSAVPGTARLHYRYDAAGPFQEVLLTSLGGGLFEGVLPATNCTSAPEYYFSVAASGGGTITSPAGAPAEALHSATVVTGISNFYNEPFDSFPGWSVQGQWGWGVPGGAGGAHGGPDPFEAHTGGTIYGYNMFGDYQADIPEHHLTSSAIDCTGRHGVRLTFWRWLGVEQPVYDHASVRVSNDGTNWTTVWQNLTEIADTSWVFQDLDISAVADNQPTVYLRWTMGPTDPAWEYCGWNIDDVGLYATECTGLTGDYNGDGDVDAGDATSFESCYSGVDVPPPPACAVFLFDADADVDCGDWAAFRAAWTQGGNPPASATCDAFAAPTPDGSPKNRYVSFTPGPAEGQPQAFRLTTVSNPGFPGMTGTPKWVAAPNALGISRLSCSAVYRDWGFGRVDVGDRDVVPGATYEIDATTNGVDFLGPVALITVPVWGDVAGSFTAGAWEPPDGSVDITDALSVLERFRNSPTAPPLTWTDLYPAAPDANAEIVDVVQVLDAFRTRPYDLSAPSPCP